MVNYRIWLSALLVMLAGLIHAGEAKTPVEEMKALAGKGLTEGMALIQKQGGFYPFSLIYLQDRLQVGAYTGDPANRPPADEYVAGMLLELRRVARGTPDATAMMIVRMHTVTQENGENLQGVWVLVDHREAPPLIVFQPLVPDKDSGHYSLGEQLIQASPDWIFEPDQ